MSPCIDLVDFSYSIKQCKTDVLHEIMNDFDVLFSVKGINEWFGISMTRNSFGIIRLISQKTVAGVRFSFWAIIQMSPSENGSAGNCSYTSTRVNRDPIIEEYEHTMFFCLAGPAEFGKIDWPSRHIRRESSSDNFSMKEPLRNHQWDRLSSTSVSKTEVLRMTFKKEVPSPLCLSSSHLQVALLTPWRHAWGVAKKSLHNQP